MNNAYSIQEVNEFLRQKSAECDRLKTAIRRARNILHAHNRPDVPLPNESRIRARDILDLALAGGDDRA